MKKTLITIAFAFIAMLGFNKSSNAQTTIDFDLHVDDGGTSPCDMPYSGYYYVRVSIIVDDTEIVCDHEQYNVVNTSNTQITWVCTTLSQFESYDVRVDICRFTPPDKFDCCDSDTRHDYSMDDLTNGQTIVTISIN